MIKRDFVKDILMGVATADAIGVPVEFKSRKWLHENPVTGMTGYGSHNQPPGTWSDDSSLSFCLAEMLSLEYNLDALANRFVNWKNHGYWTPHGLVFDIGIATSFAIGNLEAGIPAVLAGGTDERSNGNGSLMRILPLLLYIKDKDIDQRFNFVKDVSSITHRHIRSVVACFIYLELASVLLDQEEKLSAYRHVCKRVNDFLRKEEAWNEKEQAVFKRILTGNIFELCESEIGSSGYVIHTLEASLWCLLNTSCYMEAVLRAANLGEDSDTTAAITGGLAGLLYGWETIPEEWLAALARRNDIEILSERLSAKNYL
jgi:ADP-ribosyl-[dinitrogen reductase] hydrolase